MLEATKRTLVFWLITAVLVIAVAALIAQMKGIDPSNNPKHTATDSSANAEGSTRIEEIYNDTNPGTGAKTDYGTAPKSKQ